MFQFIFNLQKDYMLLQGDKCPTGLEVPKEECLDAAKSLTEYIDTIDKTTLLEGDWAGLPCGCFVYNNQKVNYDSNCGNSASHHTSNLVCKQVCYTYFFLLEPLSLLKFIGH